MPCEIASAIVLDTASDSGNLVAFLTESNAVSLIEELKRRNVFRVGVAYTVDLGAQLGRPGFHSGGGDRPSGGAGYFLGV